MRNQSVSSFPASAVASLLRLLIHSELSEKVTPMYSSAVEDALTEPIVTVTRPAMLMPKSYAVAASPVKMELPFSLLLRVRLSGYVTDPFVLCTETGWRVRDGGASMYCEYGIDARATGTSAATLVRELDTFMFPGYFLLVSVGGCWAGETGILQINPLGSTECNRVLCILPRAAMAILPRHRFPHLSADVKI
jgi:hypothetical protein